MTSTAIASILQQFRMNLTNAVIWFFFLFFKCNMLIILLTKLIQLLSEVKQAETIIKNCNQSQKLI